MQGDHLVSRSFRTTTATVRPSLSSRPATGRPVPVVPQSWLDFGGGEDNIEACAGPVLVGEVASVGGRGTGRLRCKFLDEGVLDAENGVADLDLRVAVDKDVGHEGPEARGGDHEVQVGGADGRATDGFQH